MSLRVLCAVVACGAVTLSATAQPFSTVVSDFEDPGWTVFVTKGMFVDPSVSGSTRGLDNAVTDLTYITDAGANPFSVVNSGTRASETTWGWADPADKTSWVRLLTLNADQIPNPAIHLEGKVTFWAAATAYTDATFATPVTTGVVHLGIGVRETGQGVYQGGNGGVAGDVELVGLAEYPLEIFGGTDEVCNSLADPNSDDIQVTPLNAPAGPGVVCVNPGPDGELQTVPGNDDTLLSTPKGLYTIPTDGVMRQYEFDLPALEASGNVFGFSGDGMLLAEPNNRGTLDALILTNDPGNGAAGAKVILLNVDDVEFEAPIIDPPLIQTEPDPPRPLDESVAIDIVDPDASLVELFRQRPDGTLEALGSMNPNGSTEIEIATNPLAANVSIVAQQTVGSNVSDLSSPVAVTPAGNGPLRIAMGIRETDQYDHGLNCGDDGTGFDPDAPSLLEFIGATGQDGFGVPIAPRFTPDPEWFELIFDPCAEEFGVAQFSGDGNLAINPAPDFTNGVWEGLYFRIDELSPTAGPFTVYLDDMRVMDSSGSEVCLVDDFEGYTPAEVIVGDFDGNGQCDTLAEATDVQVVPVGTPTFPGQIVVRPGADGTLETAPQGDDLLDTIHARFNDPGVAGTSQGLADAPDVSAVTNEDSFSGLQSLRVEWAFGDTANNRSHVRLTTNGSIATNPPESFLNPDSVIPFSLDGTLCDGTGDLYYSVMVKLAPPEIAADVDVDGDVDTADMAGLQLCYGAGSLVEPCTVFDVAPNGAPDGVLDFDDFELIRFLYVGPGL